MDNLTIEQRHLNMSRIRSSGTKLELKFFQLLDSNNIAYVKFPKLYGKPDCQIGEKLLVFVDSDFWHGWHFKQWKNRLPQVYWVEKIERNIKRDRKKFRMLRKQGYAVLRVWEHSLKHQKKVVIKIKQTMSDCNGAHSPILSTLISVKRFY
jgi:DNA mismatch endonuclease, patch repair protein